MNTPFTAEQFFAAFADYNRTIWPVQILFIAIAVAGVAAAVRGTRHSRAIVLGLAVAWVWMALAYHGAFFSKINPAAYAFAGVFLVQALLFWWYGVVHDRLRIADVRDVASSAVGWILIVYSVLVYPAIGYLSGQRFPAMPTFGLPCPTTIFTLGLLAWAARPVPLAVFVVPVLWAALGTSAALMFGVVEDYALPVAALAVVAL